MAELLPKASLSLIAATAAYSDVPFVCACLSYQLKLFMSSALRARPLIFYSKPSIALWNNLWQCLPNMGQGLKLELKFQIEILSFSPLKLQNNLYKVWILQSSYEYAQLNQKAAKCSDKFNAQFPTWWWGQMDNPWLWQYDLNVDQSYHKQTGYHLFEVPCCKSQA